MHVSPCAWLWFTVISQLCIFDFTGFPIFHPGLDLTNVLIITYSHLIYIPLITFWYKVCLCSSKTTKALGPIKEHKAVSRVNLMQLIKRSHIFFRCILFVQDYSFRLLLDLLFIIAAAYHKSENHENREDKRLETRMLRWSTFLCLFWNYSLKLVLFKPHY